MRPCSCLLLAVLAAFPLCAAAGEYRFGEGYTAGPVNVAGYLNLVAERPAGGPTELIVDDLSLFVGARLHRYLNPFFEAELTGVPLWRQRGAPPASGARLVLERLYNDSRLGDSLTLRVGKMLTPVGEWNAIHAAPLVATTTRPHTTYRSFPEYTSGVALLAAGNGTPELQLSWQPGGELAPRPRDKVTRRYRGHRGLQLSWPMSLSDRVGLSLQRATLEDGASQSLLGLHGRGSVGRLQLEAEATRTRIDCACAARRESGAYVLGSYAIDEHWSVIGMAEHFRDRDGGAAARTTIAGLAWRPHAALAVKLELVRQRGAVLDIRSGAAASVAVLF